MTLQSADRMPAGADTGAGDSGDFAWRDDARALIADLFTRSPAVYWADFLASTAAAWALAAVCFAAAPWSALQIGALLVAGVLFFRAGTFIHEIVHMPGAEMTAFKHVWNLVFGIPLLMPWITYRNHIEHHNHRCFGTPADGEYLPLASSPRIETLKYLAQAPLLPLLMVIRFGLLGPLSWLHRGLREWVLTRASAGVTNPHYAKRFPRSDERQLLIVEAACCAWLAAIALLAWRGTITPQHLLLAYVLLAWTLTLNWVRNLSAHRYANPGGAMTHAQQVADSINVTGQTWLTALLFPVGLRYHALHHLFPALPYHNMGAAHRRLMQQLPHDAGYRACNRSSFLESVGELWRSAGATPRQRSAMQRWEPQRPGRP